ncbi:MAG TPA: MotA/TolQ/ExbB proton channel family protein [Conexibacter sp.]
MSGDRLGDALAQIASALQLPVLLAAVLVLLTCALELGRFAAEATRRRQARRAAATLRELARRAVDEPAAGTELARRAPSAFAARALLQLAAARAAGRPRAAEHALEDFELAAQRRLDRTRLLVRAGPAIGLMGTLIPLAPGLAALGRGDMARLAADLRVAFAATVVGLLAGTLAFALTLARTRMYGEDLNALERAAEQVVDRALADAASARDAASPEPAR